MIKILFKHILFVLILMAMIVLLGCQSVSLKKSQYFAVNSAIITNALAELDQQFDNTRWIVNGLTENLTQADQIVLKTSVLQLQQLRRELLQTLKNTDDVGRFLLNVQQLNRMAYQGVESYNSCRSIIEKYWNRLSFVEQQQLLRFDQQANRLYQAINQLQKIPEGSDITQTVQDIIQIGAATARVLMMMGVL